MENEFVCQYCGKICKNKSGKSYHENSCQKNPNKIEYYIKRNYIKCQLCGNLISSNNLQKHINGHSNGNWDKRQKIISVQHEGLNCVYCGKECKNKKSLAQHEIRCKENPSELKVVPSSKWYESMYSGKAVWNKGLTKETDQRVAKCVETFKKNLQLGKFNASFCGRAVSEETKEKIRNSIHLDTLVRHNRCKWGTYKDFSCDSSWELAFVVYNLEHDILIYRNNKGFDYELNGQHHKYYPDFIIGNVYYEIKGCLNEFAKLKYDFAKQQIDLILITKKEIKPYLDYVVDKYGENFCEVLYDENKPNYMNWKCNEE